MDRKLAAMITTGSLLAAGSGYAASTALSTGSADPTKTVTIEVTGGTGPTGPAGPAGPPGPQGEPGTGGASDCPSGYTFGEAVFIQQGKGPVTLLTCIKD